MSRNVYAVHVETYRSGKNEIANEWSEEDFDWDYERHESVTDYVYASMFDSFDSEG